MSKTVIHANQFMIMFYNGRDANYHQCRPEIYNSYQGALSVAKRLASMSSYTTYLVVAIAAVVSIKSNPVEVKYSL